MEQLMDNTFCFWVGYFLHMIITILLLINFGCTGDVRVDDILLSSVETHRLCKEKHYIDPYTKLEYCLPENFQNINLIHLYRVRGE